MQIITYLIIQSHEPEGRATNRLENEPSNYAQHHLAFTRRIFLGRDEAFEFLATFTNVSKVSSVTIVLIEPLRKGRW